MTGSDASLRIFVGYGLKRAFNAVQSDLTATLAPFRLRMVTFSVLALIGENDGIRQSDLAEVTSIERPNLVLVIDELERAKLVLRMRAPDDRRAYELRLTPKGREVLAEARAAVAAHDHQMTAGMTKADRDALIAVLRKIELNGRKEHDRRTLSRS